jgi:uncharacterized protein YecE (DUF72 family)
MPILVGTASWTDKSLIDCGRFYPKEANSAEARLRYYATQFPMVEVDSSYYAMPSASNAQLWAERTPANFVFNLKAFRLFTRHQTSPTVLPKDIQSVLAGMPALAGKPLLYYRELPEDILAELWRRFLGALAPLQHAGKLKAVHFQFAPWLLCNRDGHAHVVHCVQMMQGCMPAVKMAVEFRNRTWFDAAHLQQTLAFERELRVVHVVVDGPQGFGNSVPAVWEVTHPELAIVRLHGRNSETWNLKGLAASSDRFNYDYSEQELAALASDIRRLATQVGEVQVVFNNNYEDQGSRNARTLMRLLQSKV